MKPKPAAGQELILANSSPDVTPRHHPGYQSLGHTSWWCDQCLSDCHSLQIEDTVGAAHWYDFFEWLSKLLATGLAACLGGLFAIVAYLIGGINYLPGQSSEDEHKWEQQLKWLLVRRHRLLLHLDSDRAERNQAYFHGAWQDVQELERKIANMEDDLVETLIKIEELEKKLQATSQPPIRWPYPYEIQIR